MASSKWDRWLTQGLTPKPGRWGRRWNATKKASRGTMRFVTKARRRKRKS